MQQVPTALQLATLVVAGLAVVMSTITLTWQVVSWVLSGGRARVELVAGVHNGQGQMACTRADRATIGATTPGLMAQGFDYPVIGVRVFNRGRLPIVVESWELTHPGGMSVSSTAELLGPRLPHTIQPGANEAWYQDAKVALALASAAAVISKKPPKIGGKVTFGSGRTKQARYAAVLPAGGT